MAKIRTATYFPIFHGSTSEFVGTEFRISRIRNKYPVTAGGTVPSGMSQLQVDPCIPPTYEVGKFLDDRLGYGSNLF